MGRVRVLSTNVAFDAPEGEDLLEVLQSHGIPIATSCGGDRVMRAVQAHDRPGGEALSPIKPEEIEHLGNVAKVIGLRLACQSKVCGEEEIVVDIPVVEDVEERKRRKAERLRATRTSAPRGARPREVIEWRPRADPTKKTVK